MTTPVALKYPNGRIHETALNLDIKIGDSFELYGHTWIAQRWTAEMRRRRARAEQHRVVCVLAGPASR